MAVPDYFAVVAMIGWQTGGKPPLGPGGNWGKIVGGV
jgi:hypothetical protein